MAFGGAQPRVRRSVVQKASIESQPQQMWEWPQGVASLNANKVQKKAIQTGSYFLPLSPPNNFWKMSSYALPNRRSIYPSKSLKNLPSGFSLPITYLSVVLAENDGRTLFHFRFFLVSKASDGTEESIRLDMQPSYTDMKHPMNGVVLVEYGQDEQSPDPGPTPFNVPVPSGTMADELLKIIFDENKLDQYTFCDDGRGCRHWCASVLDALAQHSIIDSSIGQSFEAYEAELYRRFGCMIPMPRIRGTFYD